jgi:creatinine amidohydrolase
LYWDRLTTRRFAELMPEVRTVLLPTGTVEAHGLHCPLGTDNFAPAALAERLEARYPDRLLVAPAIPYGHSWELEEWPGTLSIPAEALERYVAEVGKAFLRWGVRDIVVINGHGGNNGALGHAAEAIADAGGRVVITNWWLDWRDDILTVTGGQGHAGEDETSVMLALHPDWVEMEHAVFNPHQPKYRVKDRAARQVMLRQAVTGDGRGGTAAKGERILELVVDRLDQLLQDLWRDDLFQSRGQAP